MATLTFGEANRLSNIDDDGWTMDELIADDIKDARKVKDTLDEVLNIITTINSHMTVPMSREDADNYIQVCEIQARKLGSLNSWLQHAAPAAPGWRGMLRIADMCFGWLQDIVRHLA